MQRFRPLSISAGRSGDVPLVLVGVRGSEAISELFRYQLQLLTSDPSRVDPNDLLGSPVHFRIDRARGESRPFSGICTSLTEEGSTSGGDLRLGMEVRPELWRLTRRTDSRIFQRMTVPEILKDVLAVAEITFRLKEGYLPREYCVQYRETDYDFASRLMADEGIRYYFRHHDDGHELIVTDEPPGDDLNPARLELAPIADNFVDEHRITSWSKGQTLRSGRVSLRDYNFARPGSRLEASEEMPTDDVSAGPDGRSLRVGRNEAMELYEPFGGYAHFFDGVDFAGNPRPRELEKLDLVSRRAAQLRMEQEASGSVFVRGESKYRHLASGFTFEVAERSDRASSNGSVSSNKAATANGSADAGVGRYLLVSVEHRAQAGEDVRSAGDPGEDGPPAYENHFECVPAGMPYRPPHRSAKPVIHGTQTAVVVGPDREEIHTDSYGRVKVRFHWDRSSGRPPEDSSCWIRVAQTAAGGGFGAMTIPRVGQEVVVAFEEGDPDRPLVIGSVYNPSLMPTYSLGSEHNPAPPDASYGLPANKTISGWKTNTYPGGGGSNELIFNDAAGGQKVYLHAERDYDSVVNNNKSIQVKSNHKETIGADKSMDVTGNHVETIGQNMTLSVDSNRTATVKADDTETVNANQTVTVKANQSVDVGANQKLSVGSNQTASIGSKKTETVGMISMANVGIAEMETIGVAKALNVGVAYAVNVGAVMNTIVGVMSSEQVGVSKSITVGSKIELKCGASRIFMDSGGTITIEGTKVQITGSGGVKIDGEVIDLN